MGIQLKQFGEAQPICNECGIALCWSIDENEYLEWKGFWDEWKCSDCNANYEGAYIKYKQSHKPFEWVEKIKNLNKAHVMKSVCPVCEDKGWYFVNEWIGSLQGRKDCRCKGQTVL